MSTTCFTRHSSSFPTATAIIVALTLVTPVVHAAPDASCKLSASQRKQNKRIEALAKIARAKAVQDTLGAAAQEREETIVRVKSLLAIGRHQQAAEHLFTAAVDHNDPVLYLEAAEQFLVAANRHNLGAITRGRESAEAARFLLTTTGDPAVDERVDLRTVRVPYADVGELIERCATVQGRLKTRADVLRGQRKAQQEVIVGASLLVVGLGGLGVLGGGLTYRAARQHELAAIAGHESEYDLSALDAQGRRADAMIGVGAAIGVIGMMLGASLVAIGARDLHNKTRSPRARLQVAPTLGGLVLSGRF